MCLFSWFLIILIHYTYCNVIPSEIMKHTTLSEYLLNFNKYFNRDTLLRLPFCPQLLHESIANLILTMISHFQFKIVERVVVNKILTYNGTHSIIVGRESVVEI